MDAVALHGSFLRKIILPIFSAPNIFTSGGGISKKDFLVLGIVFPITLLLLSSCAVGKHNIPHQNMQLVAIYYDAAQLVDSGMGVYSPGGWDKVISLAPRFSEAYHNRGVAFAHSGEWEQALKDFERALDINPNFGLSETGRNLAKKKLRGEETKGMNIPRTCKPFHKLYEEGC